MTAVNEEGEIIYDSIIKNKEKTKKYWEQLMMAAATAKQQKVQYHSSDNIRCHLQVESDGEDGKPQSDISEQEYFDAQSHISTLSPETFDSLEHSQDEENPRSPAPKIVETVAKKLLRKEELNCLPVPVETIIKTVESVIEREIRLQKEREEALCKERELALRKAETNPVSPNQPNLISPLSPSTVPLPPRKSVILNDNSFEEKRNALNETLDMSPSAEVKIALELREMKEREEELRRLRQNLSSSKNEDKIVAVDDGFVSIPNTDEGNYSEYGSEEKELSLDGSFSRASPEVPLQGMFPHQRTQSMDSVSSGHSSSYGGNNEYYSSRRRIVMVKPFEDPNDDEIPAYMRKQKETPIEREIRLAREREEELRREKGLPPISGSVFSTPTSARTERSNVRSTMTTKDPRSVQHRLATSRIQQEIDEATEREKELRAAGKIQTMSEDTVDSKVTRFSQLGEYSMEKEELRLQRSTSVSNIPLNEQVVPDSSPSHPKLHANSSLPSLQNNGRSPQAKNTIRQIFPGKGQRGLMQRFIASRGKLNIISVPNTLPLVQNSISPFSSPDHLQTSSPVQKSTEVSNQENHTISDEVIDDVDSASRLTVRPGYTSAEKKIEVELREMQKREEELRLQRAQMFGYSHPNLLSIDDNEDEKDIENGEDINETEDEIENLHTLRTTRSIPFNLNFDDSSYVNGEVLKNKPSIGSRKKSALIEEWENKIQQNSEN